MKRKEFVVFGVGDFGMYVAKTLANSGATVMVVDKDEERLEQIASEVTHTICADATNPEAVKQLGIGNYDGAIIGVGRSLETTKEICTPRCGETLDGLLRHKHIAGILNGIDKKLYPVGDIVSH